MGAGINQLDAVRACMTLAIPREGCRSTPASLKAVWNVLVASADSSLIARPSWDEIALMSGVSRRTIPVVVRDLVGLGLLETHDGEGRTRTAYHVIIEVVIDLLKQQEGCSTWNFVVQLDAPQSEEGDSVVVQLVASQAKKKGSPLVVQLVAPQISSDATVAPQRASGSDVVVQPDAPQNRSGATEESVVVQPDAPQIFSSATSCTTNSPIKNKKNNSITSPNGRLSTFGTRTAREIAEPWRIHPDRLRRVIADAYRADRVGNGGTMSGAVHDACLWLAENGHAEDPLAELLTRLEAWRKGSHDGKRGYVPGLRKWVDNGFHQFPAEKWSEEPEAEEDSGRMSSEEIDEMVRGIGP